MQINSTIIVGLVACLSAAAATAGAAVVARRSADDRPREWGLIALINVALATEIVAGWRYRLDDVVRAVLGSEGAYAGRRPLQVAVLVALTVTGAALGVVLIQRAPTPRIAVVRGGVAAIAAVFLIEAVSLHQVDALLYQSAGPIKLIGWLWLGCAATIVAAASWPSR